MKKIIPAVLLIIMLLLTFFLTGCIEGTEEIWYDGEKRTYNIHVPTSYDSSIIHVPASYDPSISHPLLVVLHAWGENAFFIEKRTGFSEKADEEGFIVLYPDGTGRSWNAGFCCGNALRNDIDDVGFIRTLIEKTMDDYNINSSRIYVMGHSNGAMMSYRLGSELSDIVAAIGPVSGTIGRESWTIPDSDYPVSVIAFNGMKDPLVHYNGGIFFSVNESISFWVNQNNCSTTPQRNISEDGNVIVDTYSDGDNGTEVVLVSIVNASHAWPFDRPIYEKSQTDIMWEFFEKHPKQS
jgi:polyhydroxybutyrate depolymerase